MGNTDRARVHSDARRFIAAAAGRLDALIASQCPDLSRARVQRLAVEGHVHVNGVVVRKSHRVEPGDVIELTILPREHEAVESQLELPVLYEDDQVIAVDKPAGLPVHGAPGDTAPSVAAWMLARLGASADAFPVEHPGIVHRLDKDTSGVMLLAKTPAAQSALSSAFEARSVSKTYLAVTDGIPAQPRAIIDAPIARHPTDRLRMAIARGGRPSRTRFEVLGEDHGRALLLLHPETGRTHQIRVHLASIGCPVCFDRIYGTSGPGRQLLHAWRNVAPHPHSGMLEVTAPLAPDFVAFVRATALETLASEYIIAAAPRRFETKIDHRES